ncbi:hypothetical protein pb186bvf_002988 [Paramecium bursaria]
MQKSKNLSSLICKNHNRKAIKACTDLNCQQNIFICDLCNNTHSHNNDDISNIIDFPLKLYHKLKPILENQEFQRLNFNNQEQNQQIYKFLTNPQDFNQWLQNEITQFSKKINAKIDDFVRKLNQIKEDELKKFEQQYRKQFQVIQQLYESTFRYQQEYCVQNQTAFQNRILQFGDPETYLRSFKPINQINLTQLNESIKQFDQLENVKVIDFEDIFQFNSQTAQSQNLQDSIFQGYNNELQNVDKTIMKAKNTGVLQDWEAETRVTNTFQQQKNLIESGANQKQTIQTEPQNQIKQQNAKLIEKLQSYDESPRNISNIRYEEIKPSLLQRQGVKLMIFLSTEQIIFGTNDRLFTLKNSQQQQLQIPQQFDYISCLDKLDNNSFIVGGSTKGESMVCRYYKDQLDQFQSVLIQKVQGDILTMIAMSKESITFVSSEKQQKNREIQYCLYFCKYLGMPTQYNIKQDLGQAKRKKIKIYSISDNQLFLHLINEYIALIQINEKLKIFQELRKVECTMNGSVIPLMNELFLLSICVGEEKMNNIIINLNDKVKVLTGDYVWQTKSNIFDNIIAVLQITEKGKLFLVLIDKYSFPRAIENQQYLGQLDIQLLESSNFNLLVHFIGDQIYIKDEKTDSIKIYKIQIK